MTGLKNEQNSTGMLENVYEVSLAQSHVPPSGNLAEMKDSMFTIIGHISSIFTIHRKSNRERMQ